MGVAITQLPAGSGRCWKSCQRCVWPWQQQCCSGWLAVAKVAVSAAGGVVLRVALASRLVALVKLVGEVCGQSVSGVGWGQWSY